MQRIVKNIKNNFDIYKISFFLGLTGFGGLAAIDMIKKAYVVKNKIISERKFLHALSLSQVLPGSTIINLIAYFNYLKAGLIGAIIGSIIYILPSFLAMTALAAIYFQYFNIPFIKKIVDGLNILLIPLLLNALISIGKSSYFRKAGLDYVSVTVSIICFFLAFFLKIKVLPLIAVSGVLAVILYASTGFLKNEYVIKEKVVGQIFKRKKVWLSLIALISFFSFFLYSFSQPLWTLFSSFFKIGMLSFGGGVASIPLIEDVFVNKLQWLSIKQFWDGIAISQIVPGPTLISSAFFGYKIKGFAGSFMATFGVSIPSVALMIVAGKIHDRIKDNFLVRSITRGFLAGFIGLLLVLIISRIKGAILIVNL